MKLYTIVQKTLNSLINFINLNLVATPSCSVSVLAVYNDASDALKF